MKAAVVIPCYRAKSVILEVLAEIDPVVQKIYVIDDACPEHTGEHVSSSCRDPRVEVILLPVNSGVGGATIAGFLAAFRDGFEVILKIDSDHQMDARLIPAFIEPIAAKDADYVKGNRFFSPRSLRGMPASRLIGNAALSFLCKLASGYWNMMDPTNGFIAIHRNLIPFLDPDRLDKRFFFEIDLLFRLGSLRAVALDVPIWSRYADEKSNLSILHALFTFPPKLLKRIAKRFAYRYLIRDVNIATLFFVFGLLLAVFGVSFGLYHWIQDYRIHALAGGGTVMVAALPTLLGVQMLLSACMYDISSAPTVVVYPLFENLIGDEKLLSKSIGQIVHLK